MSWIEARIRFVASGAEGKSISADEAQRVVNQVRADALYGTFSELDDDFWRDRMQWPPADLSRAELAGDPEEDPALKLTRYQFKLSLKADLFPPKHGGIQHLFGILAGDLLQFTLPPIRIEKIEVLELRLPEDWVEEQLSIFRGQANMASGVRTQFKIDEGLPFLAFSFKPRIGFNLDSLEEIARGVLDAGFNLVELDTRFLVRNHAELSRLTEIARRLASAKRKHIGRFSINLSLPPDLMLTAAEQVSANIEPPVIIKVDGGLDGISGLQVLRRRGVRSPDGKPIVVTCYPLLRSTLKNFVPQSSFVGALAMSGADIIYPGGRPDLGWMVRSISGHEQEKQSLEGAVLRYRRLIEQNWPLPSIAGGIYAGQLQAFYELLGPHVAWFLGGELPYIKMVPLRAQNFAFRSLTQPPALAPKREVTGRRIFRRRSLSAL
jgi:ribulose 1,5-bisphosphate carboxylase large subunit-like protein